MIPASETFDGTFPFRPRFSTAAGFRMHYVDEGTGPPVVLLHGEPTWGYLFREVIPRLTGRYRVIAPDHMGFGKSETPPDRAYTLGAHVDNLERFVLDLDLRGVTLVMHDFGGPAGTGLALRHPDRVARLVYVNAPAPLGQPDLGERVGRNLAESQWFRWVAAAHADGSLDAVLGNLGVTALSVLKLNGFERAERATDLWIRAYASAFPTPADCLGPIGWARGVADGSLRFEPAPPDRAAAVRAKPAMAVWGMKDRTLAAGHFLPLFEAAFPAAGVYRLAAAGHYSPEDEPETVALLIDQFNHLTGGR